MNAYQKLEKKFKRVSSLGHLASISHWDEAVMMPKGGSQARAEAQAEAYVMINEIVGSKEVGDLLLQAEHDQQTLSDWQRANLREIKRAWHKANSVSSEIVEQKALAGSKCSMAWRSLRAENNWKDFLPLFKQVVSFSREEAKQRGQAGGCQPYDAMIDLYEPEQTSEKLEKVFSELRQTLPDFIRQVVEKQKSENVIRPTGPFPIERQKQLGLEIMKLFGFDFDHGRLDVSHHPFCGGVSQDVRMTTRYSDDDFTESLLGVQHETGHGLYEQGLPRDWAQQPVGTARSLGIHESQSLLFEMQVSRSRDFLEFATPMIAKYMQQQGDPDGAYTADNLARLFTRVKPGYIRVSADELTYPMHVILRFEIGRALIEGDLQPEDLPEAWDQKMQTYLGLSTKDNYKDGCMQDVHWTDGSFGYFPTYTLGAMNAAQLYAAAKSEVPEIPEQLRNGNFAPLNAWLKQKIWSKASLLSVADLMKSATGEVLNSKYFLQHLNHRYLG